MAKKVKARENPATIAIRFCICRSPLKTFTLAAIIQPNLPSQRNLYVQGDHPQHVGVRRRLRGLRQSRATRHQSRATSHKSRCSSATQLPNSSQLYPARGQVYIPLHSKQICVSLNESKRRGKIQGTTERGT